MNKRVMAFDIGMKKIGVAVSDPLGITANPLGYIEVRARRKTLAKIGELLSENDVGHVVIGVPRNMDGTIGPQAQYCIEYGREIASMFGLPVTEVDERLTSKEAERVLIDAGVSREKRKAVNDKIAASIILQQFLQRR